MLSIVYSVLIFYILINYHGDQQVIVTKSPLFIIFFLLDFPYCAVLLQLSTIKQILQMHYSICFSLKWLSKCRIINIINRTTMNDVFLTLCKQQLVTWIQPIHEWVTDWRNIHYLFAFTFFIWVDLLNQNNNFCLSCKEWMFQRIFRSYSVLRIQFKTFTCQMKSLLVFGVFYYLKATFKLRFQLPIYPSQVVRHFKTRSYKAR